MYFMWNKLVFIALLLNYFVLNVDGRRVKRIVGGSMAAAPPPDDPVVFTNLYSKNARVEGYRYSLNKNSDV